MGVSRPAPGAGESQSQRRYLGQSTGALVGVLKSIIGEVADRAERGGTRV